MIEYVSKVVQDNKIRRARQIDKQARTEAIKEQNNQFMNYKTNKIKSDIEFRSKLSQNVI